MAERNNQIVHQHQPLVAPSNWSPENGRRFVMQLEDVLDDIYRKFGRLGYNDLHKSVKDEIISFESYAEGLKDGSETVQRVKNSKVEISPDGIKLNHEGEGSSSIEINDNGISMNADGSINMVAGSIVSIQGSKGNIELTDEGSVIGANDGHFESLTVAGQDVYPLVLSETKPELKGVFWAKVTPASGGNASWTGSKVLTTVRSDEYMFYSAAESAHGSYEHDPITFQMNRTASTLATSNPAQYRYTLEVPVFLNDPRYQGSNAREMTLCARVSKRIGTGTGNRYIRFEGADAQTLRIFHMQNKVVKFTAIGTMNLLYRDSVDNLFNVFIGVQTENQGGAGNVYIKENLPIKFTAESLNAAVDPSAEQTCTLYYIPNVEE